MNHFAEPTSAGFLARRWRLLSATVAAMALTSGAAAWAVSSDSAIHPTAPSSAALFVTPVALANTSPEARTPRPAGVQIPSIHVSAPLVLLGLNKDETVEVPSNPDDAGWYHLGPAPGEPGSAVILGHVDSMSGPAVFYRLKTIRVGAEVKVVRIDGSVVRFHVVKIETYANAHFPAQKVYRNHGRRSLTLVTCGGAYDTSRGGYQANVVVWAELGGPAQSTQ